MKKIIASLLVFLFSFVVFSQSPSWAWGSGAGGGMLHDYGTSIGADAHGNCYTTGYFQVPIMIFGNDTLTGSTTYHDNIYVVKYDGSGNVKWAKSAGGQNNASGTGIVTDANGNSYLTGSFGGSGTIVFGNYTLTATNVNNSGFIAKYDSSGNVIWATTSQDSAGISGSIDLDAASNIYITGSSTSGYNMITKYNGNGSLIWQRGASGVFKSNDISTDMHGNSYVTGTFLSTNLTIGTTTLTNNSGGYVIFIVKYDSSGNLIWAKSAGGVASLYSPSISCDTIGNCYVTGYFNGTTAIFGSTTLTNAGGNDIFVAKFNNSGSVLWAKRFGSFSFDSGNSITSDAKGNSYLTGYYRGTVPFGSTTLFNSGTNDEIFAAKLDNLGNVLWAKNAPYTGVSTPNVSNSICIDNNGAAYLTGYFFSPTVTFGNDTVFNVSNTGNYANVFVAKIDSGGAVSGIENLTGLQEQINIFPNPANEYLTVRALSKLGTITIYNSLGETILQTKSKNTQEQIDISKLPAGIYIVNAQGSHVKLVKE